MINPLKLIVVARLSFRLKHILSEVLIFNNELATELKISDCEKIALQHFTIRNDGVFVSLDKKGRDTLKNRM